MSHDICSKSDALGILFSEDFSIDEVESVSAENEDVDQEEKAHADVEVLPVSYTSEQMDEAIDIAVKKATVQTRVDVEQEQKEKFDKIIVEKTQVIEKSFLEINENIKTELTSYAQKTSEAIISSVVAAFPQWADACEPLKAEKLISAISDYFSEDFKVCIKSHPDNFLLFKNGNSMEGNAGDRKLELQEDSEMNKSNFEIRWKDGFMSRDIDQIVRDILSSLEVDHPHQ